MIIDTSALVAILRDEPDAKICALAIEKSVNRRLSAANFVETSLRLDHPNNYHKDWYGWPEERKRVAWTTMFTGLLEAAMPLCRTNQERLFLQQVILERVVVFRPTRNYLYCPTNEPHSGGEFIAECFERLRTKGTRTCSPHH